MWPKTVEEAEAEQERLRHLVDREGPGPLHPAFVAGLDVAYSTDETKLVAAAVVLDTSTLSVVDEAVTAGAPAFPYVPGLFAFREVPGLLASLEDLSVRPELLVCDGHGLAHPRRFGLASHLGVLTWLPSIGVGKTPLLFDGRQLADERGAWSPMTHDGEEVGRVLRTRSGVKPVFVSPGHRMSLDNAVTQVLALTPRFRLPETTRAADHLCRQALKEA